jgi:hypothetical protein
MARKLCGIDLNGIQDYVARNWVKDAFGEDIFQDHINVGSSRSSVVSLKTLSGIEYLGGVQADLAPHGRGAGYGSTIGNPKYRTFVGDIIKSTAPSVEKLQAAVLGITPASAYAICSIPDSDSTTEAYQDALVMALRKAKFQHPLLVWRSVLASLALVEIDIAKVPCSVGIVSHTHVGFDFQTLDLKSYNHQGSNILVPERKKIGITCEHSAGYDSLFSIALGQLDPINSDPFLDVRQSKNIAALGLGRNVKSELLRSKNGLWRELTPPSELDTPDLNFTDNREQTLTRLKSCDLLVLETFTEGRLQSRIHSFIENVLGRDVELLCDDAIAKAALFAADRYAKDVPIYFDYLPQISTIVQTGLEPTNFDLIDQSETLWAGTVYRSKKPAILGTQAGQKEIEIYLKKEGDKQPRQARIKLPVAATSTHSVSLYVEQTPAQGRAAIQINAVDLGLSQTIDFQAAEILDVTWEELLKNIKVGSVPIPERMIKPAKIENWVDTHEEGLQSIIRREVNKEFPDWDELQSKIGGAVSSDGELPGSISVSTERALNELTEKAFAHFQGRLSGVVEADNISLRFLTWQYKRCPQKVCEDLLSVWDHFGNKSFSHPLLLHSQSWVLVFQGVGRAVHEPAIEKKALRELVKKPIETWHWQAQTACASFLLSRSKTAHEFLDSALVSSLADRVKIEFKSNFRTSYHEFRYTPFLLAGLLRYRHKNQNFLVLGIDPLADEIMELIEIAKKDLIDLKNGETITKLNRERYSYWLSEIEKYIKCEGGNPKLLIDIFENKSKSSIDDGVR